MITHPDGTSTPVIDASVHIFCRSNKDLRSFLREPFKSRGFPDYEMDWYGAPGGEYAPNTEGPDRRYPGSDPDFVGEQLFARARRRRRDPAPDDAGHHARSAPGHGDRGRAQRDDGVALAGGQRLHRPVPRHHPGQSRRHRRGAARDRQVQGPPAGRADRRPAAVPRAVRQAAVLAAVGSRRRGQPAGRGAHRGRRRAVVRRRRRRASPGPTSSTSASWR